MSNSDKNTLSFQRIAGSDTISQFMEKVNNNFEEIIKNNGGPAGVKGDDGNQGVPTKPKVPIHVWVAGEDYSNEIKSNDSFEIVNIYNNLSNVKYQEGHLIILENAHLYRLEKIDVNLKPKYILSLQSYDPASIVNGKNAYVHLAYADNADGSVGFIKQDDIYNGSIDVSNKAHMGIYTNNNEISSDYPSDYTWLRIQGTQGTQGIQGEQGPKGDKGDQGIPGPKGDGYTGHPYTVDLEGDMSTISIDHDRTILYSDDYCFCKAHAYYGNDNVVLPVGHVSVNLPSGYSYINNNDRDIVDEKGNPVGRIQKRQIGNDVDITFTPDVNFIFPKNTILFTVHVETEIDDENDSNTYEFTRDLVWMVKGIISTFELEILPQYRTIKLFDDGQYYPEKLLVTVYKVEDGKREVFDFKTKNTDFTLWYKNLDKTEWIEYPDDGVDTEGVSCLEFKVVRYYGTTDEEIWDYEDVWVVADGKSVHYYHADLGNTESMMVLTTGRRKKINDGSEDDPIYCAELINESGYSITFEPKFYDGTSELEVTDVNIGTINGEEYALEGSFERELGELIVEEVDGVKTYKSKFTITKVPYGVDMIPMTFDVRAKCPTYDNFGNIVGEEHKNNTVSFNVYISTLYSLYTLVPTVSAYNTSTGKTGDTIGCNVYKNDIHIQTSDLDENALSLKYIIRDGGTKPKEPIKYTEPIIYGDDSDIDEDEFTAKDVAIEFILYYSGNEVTRSTVPLIKDGIDGRDGDSWQYIFCRSPYYPFGNTNTGISDPSKWEKDPYPEDSSKEYLGEKEDGYENIEDDKKWYDDHKGVDSINRYEYQAYRKWDKDNKCWGKYGYPTLYSNYSESGSGYSVLLSNPVAVIPVGDNNWVVGDDDIDEIQSDSTLVYLYNNTSDISSHNNVNITLPKNYNKVEHFSIIKDNTTNNICKVTFNPVVDGKYFDFGSNTQYKLPITLTYNLGEDSDNDGADDNFTSTINWTLSPIKGLEDVELFVDKRVVNTSVSPTHTFRVGYYLISSNGSRKFIENRNDGNINKYEIFLTDNIEELPNIYVSNWQDATYEFGENKNCYVVLVDSNDKNKIIDYINIISVNDGKSSIHLELTQDYISLPANPEGITNDNGAIHPVHENAIQSIMRLYNGDQLIVNDLKNPIIEYSFKINGEELGDNDNISVDGKGGFTIPKSLIKGDTNIECIATYNGTSYSKILFIDLENTPYELEINQNVITRDEDGKTITTDKLTVRVKYWMNGVWNYTKEGDVYLIDSAKPNNPIRIENIEVGDKLYIRHITLSNLEIYGSDVKISYKRNNKELSYEIIGIINNGKDGKDSVAPSLTETTILGYSSKKDANKDENENIIGNDNSDWVKSIDKLGTIGSGEPIYILNKYEWSDGKTTRGITVTLAGTQGIEGKSRVLFYLGSYEREKATLSKSIPTVFNDIRCDYYIDSNGNAWMRKGKTTDGTEIINAVETVPDGSNLPNDNWEASTKVGFLQAGAITAEMINASSLTSNSALIDEIKAIEISADRITSGELIIGEGNGKVKIGDGSITANMIDADELKIKAANITGTLTIGNKSIGNSDSDSDEGDESFNINTDDIIYSINSESNETTINGSKITTGTITSKQINVNELCVKNLNTVTDGYKNSVNISENTMSIYDSNDNLVCSFSDDNINFTPDTAFVLGNTGNIVINRPIIKDEILIPVQPDIYDPDMSDVQPINETLNSTGEQLKQSVFEYTDKNKDISRIHDVPDIGTILYDINNTYYTYNINHIIKPTLSLGENLLFPGDIISIKTNLKTAFNFENILENDGDKIEIERKIFVNVYNSGGVIMKTLSANDDTEKVYITTSNDDNEKLYIDHGKIEFEDYTITKNDKYRFSVGVEGFVKVTKIKTQSNNGIIVTPVTSFLPFTINSCRVDEASYCEIDATIKYNNVVDGDSDITGDSDINNDTKIYKTLIGKNGLYVNNNNNGIFIGDDGIILKFDNYGLKLTKDGIEVSKNLEDSEYEWTQLTIL